MKYAIVLPDGAADEPLEELGGKTVLEVAKTPNMDWIAMNGRQGTVVTVPPAFLPGSDVATLSLLGCDPTRYYSGRAPLEAVARDIAVGARDIVFRCNFVTVADGKMLDFTAGHISQPEARRLIEDLSGRFAGQPVEFFEGVQYRHLVVLRDVGDLQCTCTPPHDIPDQPVGGHMPKGKDGARVAEIMEAGHALLQDHEVNVVRRDLGENPATHIWLWGQGRVTPFEPLTKRFAVHGASIAAVDLIRGITRLNGFTQIEVPGATGYLDTDYAAKGAAAVAALDDHDLVLVHVEAPDEAGHLGNVQEKRLAIERVDAQIVGPLLQRLRGAAQWRILVAPDHPTPLGKRVHTRTPPPFCLAGTNVQAVLGRPFSEAAAAESDLHIDPGHELMEYFIRG